MKGGVKMENQNNGVNGEGQGNPTGSPAAQNPTGQQPSGEGNVQPNAGGTPAQGSTEPNPQGQGGQGGGTEQTVPYSRFKEVNDELADIKARNAADALLKSGTEGNGQPNPQPQPSGQGNNNFVTKEEMETSLAARERIAEAKVIMSSHDGSDGLPKFDINVVTDYMKKNGLQGASYESVYNLLNHDAIVAKSVNDALNGNVGQTPTSGQVVTTEPLKQGQVSKEGIAKMTPEEYAKSGGSSALRDKMLSGQIK